MTTRTRAGWIACAIFGLLAGQAITGQVLAQPAKFGCASQPAAQGTQILQCATAITIVTEDGAKFELRDRNRDGHVDSIELSNKALLIEVPKKPGGNRFNVVTPQAIAAVRGTKWAVDASEGKTSVFVVDGSVNVARPAGGGRSRSQARRRRRCRSIRPIDRQALAACARRGLDGEVGAIRP